MELLTAGAYAISKKVKIKKEEEREAKRQGYEDRYKELMEEHDQHSSGKTQMASRSQSLVNRDEDNTGVENELEAETDMSRSHTRTQTWSGQGRTPSGQRCTPSYTTGNTFNHDLLESEAKKARTSQEGLSKDRHWDADDDDDDGPTRWVNDVVLERTRSRSFPNS